MHRSIKAMYIKTAHFSPHLDMQSYPVTLKNGKCPKNITFLFRMMYLCKFGQNIYRLGVQTK